MSFALCLHPLAAVSDRGLSDEARTLRSMATAPQSGTPSIVSAERREAALRAFLSALTDAEEAGWDGYLARPADPDAFVYAIQFLDCLPSAVPLPEIAVDADGDIALEWDRGPRRIFSVRISKDGTIHYAGLFGYATLHGSEQLSEVVPSAISGGIGRALSGPGLRAAS